MSHETEKKRWQRNFADLLQELRVAQTGVQILFAFLLTLPFSAQFGKTTELQKDTYVVALLAAAAAAALIISPVAFHRALFRQGRKPELVVYSHKMASGGLFFLLIAMVSSVFLVTDFVLDQTVALILSAATGVWFVTFWGALPFLRRNWMDEDVDQEEFADEQEAEADEAADRAGRVDRAGRTGDPTD
ncbi:DUF6328 family protein [Micromonospora zhanjiangensis]|uniref:DUF6328 family protein n=1 Tax=Micromonospora zhanjiangensis TaxID=1522057 RepID=A0ABV8KQK6_9ACTN